MLQDLLLQCLHLERLGRMLLQQRGLLLLLCLLLRVGLLQQLQQLDTSKGSAWCSSTNTTNS